MKIITVERYQCETCNKVYKTKEAAQKCESRAVTLAGVKEGERVRITQGRYTGWSAVVQSVLKVGSEERQKMLMDVFRALSHTDIVCAETEIGGNSAFLLPTSYRLMK